MTPKQYARILVAMLETKLDPSDFDKVTKELAEFVE